MKKLLLLFTVVFASCEKPCYECTFGGTFGTEIEICGNQATMMQNGEPYTWEVDPSCFVSMLEISGYWCEIQSGK
jgi:hypothetical protein